MSNPGSFTDPAEITTMEAEHLPLWRAYLRLLAPLVKAETRVLDFGCSRGGLLSLLFREGGGQAETIRPLLGVGLDLDLPVMKEHLAEAARRHGGRYPLLFSTAAPGSFPGQFELAISHEVVYLLADLAPALTGLFAALVPGGHFCFTTGCHRENPLWPVWRASFRAAGITAHERGIEEYEAALLEAGFSQIRRDRLLLTAEEYRRWVQTRASAAPNPAWFPGAAEEENYYTRIGKMVLTASKD